MLLNQQIDRRNCIVVSHLKSTAYRNKISFKLGYRAVNARKYVRCARTFYYILYLQSANLLEKFTYTVNTLVLNNHQDPKFSHIDLKLVVHKV